MDYLHWIFLVIYVSLAIGAMVTILLDDRQPAKTMAWVLVLMFMPLMGIVLYIFFGQNIRRERVISQHSLDQLTKRSMLEFVEQRHLALPEYYRRLIGLFTRQSWALPFVNNDIEVLINGCEFFPALLRDIAQARHHVHLDFYIFNNDALGHLISDALIAKAEEGVEVRVIYDDVGCWRVPDHFFERMKNHGVDVLPFMPVHFPAFTSKANYRNHRKIVVIDGRIGYIGGMNIADRYVKGTRRQPWRDTQLRIQGSAVYGLQRAFLVDWYFVGRSLVSDRKYYPDFKLPHNECLTQVVTSNPIDPWPEIEQGYVSIFHNARRYVYIETPYFLPTEPILFAMRTAALSGVDVRLMIPRYADAKLVEWASRSFVKETIDAGVQVLLYTAGFNHSKLLVCDDDLASVGSANVDFRSFENNFESNVFIYDQKMALRIKQVFLDDQEHSVPIEQVRQLYHRSFFKRLGESLLRLLSPLM